MRQKKDRIMLEDVYFEEDYINLYLDDESSYLDFSFNQDQNAFSNRTLKKTIQQIGKVTVKNGNLHDLETAYGYGGYRTSSQNPEFIKQAMEAYSQFCAEENIVAEFIRFLPFNLFPHQFPQYFDFLIPDRQTVIVDLTVSKQQRWSQYDANTRNVLRKAEKNLTFSRADNVAIFMEMYYETMRRNQAEEFYFFDEAYFKKIISLKNCELYEVRLGEEVICSSFVLLGKEIAHYHLSANRTEFLKYNGNYFLLDNLFEQARTNGKKYFHLGGGRTNLPDDSLFLFKRKFSKNSLTFYIAGKIFMPPTYRELCNLWQQQTDRQQKYFLKYRLPL